MELPRFKDSVAAMGTSSIPILEADFDQVLGISLCLLMGRIVGNTHSTKRFGQKRALSEQLKHYKERIRSQKYDRMRDSFNYFHAGLVKLLSFSFAEEENFDQFDISAEAATELANYEVYQLFWESAQKAWEVFSSIVNEYLTLHSVASFTYEDIRDSGNTFSNLLLATKVLVATSFFRYLERNFAGIVRPEYTRASAEVAEKSPEDIVNLLMDSKYIDVTVNQLKKQKYKKLNSGKSFNLSFKFMSSNSFRNSNKNLAKPGKIIQDLEGPVSYILRHSLAIERIVSRYYPSRRERKNYNKLFRLSEHPSVFHRKVIFHAPVDLDIESEHVRLALITEDSDTSLLTTRKDTTEVVVVDNEALRPLAHISTADDFEICSSASSKEWLIFGDKVGNISLYNFKHDASSEQSLKSRACEIRAMVVSTSGERLFVGDAVGEVSEWSLLSFQKVDDFTKDQEIRDPVTCLITDERPSWEKRYEAKILVSGHQDGTLNIWNIADARAAKHLVFTLSRAHKEAVSAIAVIKDELYSAGRDRCLKVWDVEQKENLATVPCKHVPHAISIDSDAIIVGMGRNLVFYEKTYLIEVERLILPKPIYSMSIDRRRRLYTVDEDVRIWDLEGLLETMVMKPDKDPRSLRGFMKRRSSFQSNRQNKDASELLMNLSSKSMGAELEVTLDDILQDPKTRKLFMTHLKEHYADENLQFWLTVQRYKHMAEFCKQETLAKYGREIIEEHIQSKSPKQVNLNAEMKDQLVGLQPIEFNSETFNESLTEVYTLLRSNYLNEFLLKFQRNTSSRFWGF